MGGGGTKEKGSRKERGGGEEGREESGGKERGGREREITSVVSSGNKVPREQRREMVSKETPYIALPLSRLTCNSVSYSWYSTVWVPHVCPHYIEPTTRHGGRGEGRTSIFQLVSSLVKVLRLSHFSSTGR